MSEKLDVRRLPGTQTADAAVGQGYFPVITRLGGSELLMAYRGGAGHIGLGGRLDVGRSLDGGLTWSAPVTVADSERDDRNPALGVAPDGTLVLAYHWQGSYDEEGAWKPEMGRTDTRVVFSTDGGHSWVDDALIDYAPINGASPFGKIFTADGVMHMLIYGGGHPICEPGGVTVRVGEGASTPTYILRSKDNGRSWGDPTLVALGLNESDVALLPDGRWLFVARSEDRAEQALYSCVSEDGGYTWRLVGRVTDAKEHPPDLTLLPNGWLLLVFGRRHPPFGVEGLISRDGGTTWDARRLVFDDSLPGGDIGYPSTARLDDGRLVTAYYTAGTPNRQWELFRAVDAACKVVTYDAASLIHHWTKNA
ncbi:MAG: exo-alpha-sialidase [Gemmatimonadetes bacterium]|nr:exo-alpha-sialidase [Gemmatimonadota bacterium]MYH20151.1 exo-alpha-sialidase [Gemmatimonadota bacterium]MYK99499.1 exo-alpha-sialidase [Gemmatimonadota bacterium]